MDDILVRSMTSIFRLDVETTSEGIERTRSLPQGDPAASLLFSIILDTFAVRFEKMARRRRWGKQLQDGSWADSVLFADNYWMIATSPVMLENMTVAWLGLLKEYGWDTYGRTRVVHDAGRWRSGPAPHRHQKVHENHGAGWGSTYREPSSPLTINSTSSWSAC